MLKGGISWFGVLRKTYWVVQNSIEEEEMNFESPSISSSKHQNMKFLLLTKNQLESISDLIVICAQSWGHIEVCRVLKK